MLISCQDAAVIFMKLPKLVFLSISVTDRRPSTIGQSTVPIILENLVTFVLKTQRLLSLQTLVHRLSLPSLREFSIKDISPEGIRPLLNFLTRSSCSLDRLKIRGSYLSPGDNLNVLTHSSCDSLTWLTIGPSTYYEHGSVDEEVLQRLTLHRNDTVCHHLTFLAIKFCIPTPLHSTLLNMVKSRIKSHTSQVPEESALRYLKLRVEYLKDAAAELDKVGRKSGMEYSRTKRLIVTSVRFRRQGFREPPNIGEPF
ncbi:hypothetical protein F5887DRAFT_1026108 [Amanita rubescens]|nr:hypothetical protein F5887DRAFT_1026108 [Amanita rubescens]